MKNLQYRDIRFTKIPRALRFNDRISMRTSTELREPFLDHQLLEFAFRQPQRRKIHNGIHKRFLRDLSKQLLPASITEAPKRPIQTPQREWLRGPLQPWVRDQVDLALATQPDWFDRNSLQSALSTYCSGQSDNSFYVWQWISLGMILSK